ncbi:MAG: outer membrane beta-barrel protein [Flavobacteriaceae bacterium]|nr:outer membrane beta-barrel protein [Flavobacteriaceae bacterium]
MKKVILSIFLFVTLIFNANAQLDFGLKGGLNYDFSGDINDLGTNIQSSADDIKHGADSKMGYHMGVWFKVKFLNIFLRPELVYTQTEKQYDITSLESIKTKKIDVPVVLGTKILGPLYVFGGPSFQYILENDFSIKTSEVDIDEFTVGLNLGAGVEIGKLGLEIRWEKGITQDEKAKIITNLSTQNFEIDNRPNQIIFSLNYKLN